MAKNDKKSNGKKDNDVKDKELEQEREEGKGSRVVTILIIFIIVIIWLAIFGVLIKLNVGNFGSGVLYPVLKDVPVINRILPSGNDDNYAGKYHFSSMDEAVSRVKELESQLETTNDTNSADSSQISDLKKEIARLQGYENDKKAFDERVKEFDDKVVFNDKAPTLEEYKTFYEGIQPDNAEKIYKEVLEKIQYTQKIKNQADIYSKMEPAQAAKVFETMTSDLDLLASILDNMSQSKSALILQNMPAETAAQITKKMTMK